MHSSSHLLVCSPKGGYLRFVCLSDTHSKHDAYKDRVPSGDVLLHAGDFTKMGNLQDVEAFCSFLDTLPHKHKVIIAGMSFRIAQSEISLTVYFAGNHEVSLDEPFYATEWKKFRHPERLDSQNIVKILNQHCVYLQDSEITIGGIRIFGECLL